ncbi:MAG: hypothetical protein WCG80_02545 [Spirochaetales bacterium]
MIDLISVYLPGQRPTSDVDFTQTTRRFGTRMADKNLLIRPYKDGTLLQGSLPKYWAGENASTLSRFQLQATLSKLEARTGLDLREGKLFAFEVGKTLLVNRPPREYLDTWYSFGRFKKWTVADCQTVKFVTEGRSFIGYDKRLQMKGQPMPEVFAGYHALRMELKYRNRKAVWKIYGRNLSPWDLTERHVLDDLENRWREFYRRIPKPRQVRIDLAGLTQKEFMTVLAHVGAKSYGYDRMNHLLSDGQKAGDVDRYVTSRIKAALREIAADDRLTDTTSLTEEVDDAVRRS